jgi:mono/diheme cytochrome c family protein
MSRMPSPPRVAAALLLAGLLLATLACTRKPTATARLASAATATPAPAPTYEARQGKLVYDHYCATCHGDSGAGDGFNAFNLDPHPRDLSDPAFQKTRSDADLADAIRRGGAGVGLSALMPPWGHTLSERQVGQLVAYLRTLRRTVG